MKHQFFSGKVDSYVEQVTRKLANYLGDVLEDQRERLLENLVANGMDLASYMTRFQWDMAKYPIRQSLKNLTDIIGKAFNQMFEKMKGVEFSKSSFAVHCKVQPLLDPILYFVFIRRSPSPSPNEIHILI